MRSTSSRSDRTTSPELLVAVDRSSAVPARQQIEDALRGAVRAGTLAAGTRLPSTRALAVDLRVARGVVVEAYEQLVAEGYLLSRRGSGTTVASLPATPVPVLAPSATAPSAPGGAGVGRATGVAGVGNGGGSGLRWDFRPGIPDLALFPRQQWQRAARAGLAALPDADLGYGDPRGLPSLRAELASYLGRVRGVVADPDRIVVTSGFAQGLALVAAALVDARGRGCRVGVEDPGGPGQRSLLAYAGANPVPVPVDAHGLDPATLGGCVAALVTPAHQFPTGVVLTSARRAALLDWARRRNAYVLEDDYDAEYRFDREPIGAVQGLDPDRVVYAGSLSKSLAPALRIGWLVLPGPLVEGVLRGRSATDLAPPVLAQAALRTFLAAGELDRHLRRTRLAYRERRDRLALAVARDAPDLELAGIPAGLHAVGLLPPGTDEAGVVAGAAAASVGVYPMAAYRVVPRPGDRPGIVLGYAPLRPDAIAEGVRRLGAVLGVAPIRA
ncbi:MAG TPA: PLP-dependent aminotransferase family protein [Mycobacteriales bacterium]